MRILVCECIHEVASFNPVPTRYEDFFVSGGAAMLARHRGVGSEVGGALSVFDEAAPLTIVPGYSARGITSGGTIPANDFRRLAEEFLAAVRAAGKVDGVYFALHGAMAVEGEDDPEGFLLEQSRRLLGEGIPLVASFDLHGILTDRMLQHCDAITIYHTYPHVDFFETGQRAARLLLRLLRGEICPVTARVAIPALVRGDELITATGFFGQLVGKARAIEQGPGGLSAGVFIGNPFTDVLDLGSNTVVVMDGDADRAGRAATALAEEFWSQRQRMQAHLTSVTESVRRAVETRGTVVLMDPADATSSGAPGDSNAILSEIVRVGYRGRCLIPLVDPAAVEAAFAVGVGGRLQTKVGAAFDARRNTPLDIEAHVRLLSDGRFRSESFGHEWYAGRTAVLQAENVTLVVTSRPVHLFDRSLFHAHGQDPKTFDLVVVKSPHCQPHMFADWCALLLNVDAPGATSANLPTLGHQRCRRPIFPLEPETTFAPTVKLFSRVAH